MAKAPLSEVLITEQLYRRASRKVDDRALDAAVLDLNRILSLSPHDVLQKLAEKALILCRAHSVVISVLDRDEHDDRFHWRAVAGELSGFLGVAMPRSNSPCGMVLDQDAALLFAYPERHFAFAAPMLHPIREALLTPFYDAYGVARGAIWIVAHQEHRRFDAEDLLLIKGLAVFARSAMATLESLGYEQRHEKRRRAQPARAAARERRNA